MVSKYIKYNAQRFSIRKRVKIQLLNLHLFELISLKSAFPIARFDLLQNTLCVFFDSERLDICPQASDTRMCRLNVSDQGRSER